MSEQDIEYLERYVKAEGRNYTNAFNRELMLYSLEDISFKKPISLKKAGYILGSLLFLTLPMILIFGVPTTLFKALIMIGLPIVIALLLAKPIFPGERTFLGYMIPVIGYLSRSPRVWADLIQKRKPLPYQVNEEIWVSRRRELKMLAEEKEKEKG